MTTTQEPIIRSKYLAVGCAIVALPFVLALLLTLAGAWNPFVGRFLSSFQIRNESGQEVWITPIGMWEGSGRIGPLPLYQARAYMLRDSRTSKRRLLPGQSISLIYDMDDINFRHILVRDAAGELRILDTDRKGTIGLCYGAQRAVYSIPRLRSLRRAPNELRACESGDDVDYAPLRIDYN